MQPRRAAAREKFGGEKSVKKDLPKAKIQPFPKIRELVIDLVRTGYKTHTIHGLIEVDISKPQAVIREYQRRIRHSISFSAYLIYCISRAAEKHPLIHAYRKGKKELIFFDDVDVNTLFEKTKPDGVVVPVGYIYRAANKKSLAEINYESRVTLKDSLMNDKGVKRRARMLKLPAILRKLLWKIIESDPYKLKDHRGTIGFTNVGFFFGSRPGWAVPITPSTAIAVGGTYDKLVLKNGVPQNQRTLCLTISVNHDIIDGAPATRFGEMLATLIEDAAGLDEQFIEESLKLYQKNGDRSPDAHPVFIKTPRERK